MEEKQRQTEIVEEAEKRLRDFVEQNPYLKEFQDEIDRRLRLAVTSKNRQEVVAFMMAERMSAMAREVAKIGNIASFLAKGKEKTTIYPQTKTVKCPDCWREITVALKINVSEHKDGYHGECPGPHCGYWHFEDLTEKQGE